MTAPTSSHPTTNPSPSGERIVDVELTEEMEGSFLEYAYSVIYQRALPDARDGLKPVQRRIIYQMAQMGLSPEKGHVKSARVVGDVMGKLHPHGDSAIYDALVRLAQPFSMRIPLVDGHGNFGSLDDGPAAARYTEARLRPEAMAMVSDLDEDVVDFVPNYDNQLTQPSVLPAAFPSLLVNGASGIAVGMATNMAPHNLAEVISAACHLIENPDATLEDLMRFVPGPDLPTGGTIIGSEGISDAYQTGRGSFKTRATVTVEQVGPRKTGLVVTELPYLVGPERVIDKIKDAVNSKKLVGISDVTDLTDRHHGLRLVVGVKSGFDPEAVLSELYRLTPLEENFSINSVALVEGQPQTLGLKELLQVYVGHRISVVTRRSAYRLEQRTQRLHLVEGLLVAIVDIDQVIRVIRGSDDTDAARKSLQETLDLSELQAEYILELRLRRLTKFSRIELETEREKLADEILELRALLADPELLKKTVSSELEEVSEAFGTPRRSRLDGAAPAPTPQRKAPVSLEISDAACAVLVSQTGLIARVTWPADGVIVPQKRMPHDGLLAHVHGRLRGKMVALTSRGNAHTFEPMDLPEVPTEKVTLQLGVPIRDFLGLAPEDGDVVGVFSLEEEPVIMLGTKSGVVKRVALQGLQDRTVTPVIALKEGDTVRGVGLSPDDSHIVFITDAAQLLHYPASAVRAQGLPAAGMTGISLPAGVSVVWSGTADPGSAEVITLSGSRSVLPGTEALRIKQTPLSEFPTKGRATAGVRAHSFLKGEDLLLQAFVGTRPLLMGSRGTPVEVNLEPAKRDASGGPLDSAVETIGEALS